MRTICVYISAILMFEYIDAQNCISIIYFYKGERFQTNQSCKNSMLIKEFYSLFLIYISSWQANKQTDFIFSGEKLQDIIIHVKPKLL